jgi:hypothetical protein
VGHAASLKKLEENAKLDRPIILAKLGVSGHSFSALRAIAAIQKCGAELVLKTSDGMTSHFPTVDANVLAAARGDDDADVPVNGLISGIDAGRDGRLHVRVEQGSWIHTTKGTLVELCTWLSEQKAIVGTASLRDGTLTIDDFRLLTPPVQSGLPFDRGRRHEQRTTTDPDA